MKIEIKKSLFDIKTSIESVEDYLGKNPTFEKYQSNKILRRVIKREIEIIGKATNRILKNDTTIKITNSRKIVDTRNLIIHSYDSVDDIIIWGIITIYLPTLKNEVEFLLID